MKQKMMTSDEIRAWLEFLQKAYKANRCLNDPDDRNAALDSGLVSGLILALGTVLGRKIPIGEWGTYPWLCPPSACRWLQKPEDPVTACRQRVWVEERRMYFHCGAPSVRMTYGVPVCKKHGLGEK